MSRLATSFVLGYHGCDRSVAERAIAGDLALLKSERDYDWLGPGIYFWESDPVRALEWAEAKVERGEYRRAAVVGAVIDLRNCLDLSSREDVALVQAAHGSLVAALTKEGGSIPENRNLKGKVGEDRVLRFLDCAVIKQLHSIIAASDTVAPFDTVRAIFPEGTAAYPGSGFRALSHVQIAVVNPATCIKGLFWPP